LKQKETVIMKIAVIIFVVYLQYIACWPARNVKRFPCHKHLDIISDWPDGFRGKLILPVLEDMQVLPDSMKDGDVKLKFNHAIQTLDVPEGEHSRRKVVANKDFSLFIKFKHQLKILRNGDNFELDISVHFNRALKGKVGISQIDFASFHCPVVAEEEPKLPDCSGYVRKIDNTFPDGYRAELYNIPVKTKMRGWNLELGFKNDLFVLDVPHGVRTPNERNTKKFYIENREYNYLLKPNSKFELEFTVHFDRNKYKKSSMYVNYIRLADFECRTT